MLEEYLFDKVKMLEYFDQLIKLEKHQKSRIEKFFNTLSDKDLEIWIPKFLKWEEKYEEFWYKKGVQTNSILFNILIEIIELKSKHISLKEDFLSTAFFWNGYKFKLYCGQGSFWRILKGKKIIFQSA